MAKNPFNAIVSDFNKKFRGSNITPNELKEKIKILKLENRGTLEQALIPLSFIYFEKQDYSFSKSFPINSIDEAKKCMEKLFKDPIKYEDSNFLIYIKNKFKSGYDKQGFPTHSCSRNELAIYDSHKKMFFCVSSSVLESFKKIIRKSKIIKGEIPINKVNKNFLSNILRSKTMKIYEIEFHNISEPGIPDFYFRAGSKKKNINTKIKEIIGKITKGKIFAFNIKSLLVSEKNYSNKKERIRLSIKPQGVRKYQIIIQTRTPSIQLKEKIIQIFSDLGVTFEEELIFEDEPFEDSIFQLIRKRKIEDYSEYKKEIEEWDKNNFLVYKNKRLYPNEDKIIEFIKIITKSRFEFDEIIQPIENLKIKGFVLSRRDDEKRIFLFFNRGSKVDSDRIEKLMADKRIPFISININKKNLTCLQEIPFSYLNEKTPSEFITLINEIINNPHLYENLKKNYKNSCKELDSIRRRLSKTKKSNAKGDKWERICNNILNYVFNDSYPLGRSYLPDGITYFNSNETILWDAKALQSKNSYFKNSIKGKKKGTIKDTFYIEIFKKYNVNFDYYAYLGVGITKGEFKEVKKRIIRYLKKKNINTKIVFITENWLKSLSEKFEIEDVSRLHKNLPEIVNMIKKEFEKGYLDNFELDFDNVGKKTLIDSTEIRKEVKELMNS
jgi:hypothetical protein